MRGQVVNVDMQGGVATVTVAEALVGQVNLRFVPVGGGEARVSCRTGSPHPVPPATVARHA